MLELTIPSWFFLISAPIVFPLIYFWLIRYVLKTSVKSRLGRQLSVPFIGILIVIECCIIEMNMLGSNLVAGIPLYAISIGIFIVTFYYFGKSLKTYRDAIERTTVGLDSSLQDTTAASTQISASAVGIVHKASELESTLRTLEKASNKMEIITINANIEAGRLGYEGRGFSTVVSELQKLNDEMKQQAERSRKGLIDFLKHAEEISSATEEQTATMEEISNVVGKLTDEVRT